MYNISLFLTVGTHLPSELDVYA